MMGERYLTGSRVAPSAYEGNRTGGVMRRPHLPLPKFVDFKFTHQRQNRGALGRLGLRHRGQNARQALREHAFSGSRRPH